MKKIFNEKFNFPHSEPIRIIKFTQTKNARMTITHMTITQRKAISSTYIKKLKRNKKRVHLQKLIKTDQTKWVELMKNSQIILKQLYR